MAYRAAAPYLPLYLRHWVPLKDHLLTDFNSNNSVEDEPHHLSEVSS